MRNRSHLLFAIGLCWLWASPAAAEDAEADASIASETIGVSAESAQPAEPIDGPVAQQSGWQFSTYTYLWLSGMSGDMGVVEQVAPVEVDLSFGDILSHLKFAFMGAAEARRGRFVATGDTMFIKLKASDDVEIREVDFLDVTLKSTTFITTVTAGYRALDEDRLYFDLFGGARLNMMKVGLDLDGPQRSFSGSKTETWLDPIIGARFQMPLGPRWTAKTYADLGGFGIGSHLTWQLSGTIDYDISRRWSLSAGWRHLSIDFEDDGYVFDASMDGPILGAIYRF